jgi:hypothetical protein
MARDHARIQTARQRDREWRALTVDAQWTYDQVLTSEGISYVGVIDYFPGRLAALANGMTAKRVETAVKALEELRFIVVDRDTAELCARTFVRHDGVLARVNMGKAMGRALAKVVSLPVREAILDELAKCYRDDRKAAGWDGFRELFPDDFDAVTTLASRMPLRIASGM